MISYYHDEQLSFRCGTHSKHFPSAQEREETPPQRLLSLDHPRHPWRPPGVGPDRRHDVHVPRSIAAIRVPLERRAGRRCGGGPPLRSVVAGGA